MVFNKRSNSNKSVLISFFEIILPKCLFSLKFENNKIEYDRYKLLTLLIVFINSQYLNNSCEQFVSK